MVGALISGNAFFSGTLNTVDAVIDNFVNLAYAHFVQANSGIIAMLFTVYIMVLGYQILTHTISMHLGELTKHIVLLLCVYGLVMNWNLYNLFVYRIFTIEPGNIAKILIQASGKYHSVGSIADTLDSIYTIVINTTMEFFGQFNFSSTGFSFLMYGCLVYIIGTLMTVFALLLFIYAKMMLSISLALGPIFLLFLLWDSTRNLFSSWLSSLITIALIPIVTSAALVLMLSVIKVTLSGINLPAEHLQFNGIAPFLGLSLTTSLILAQVFRICSALGGGITLASISAGGKIASAAWQKSGLAIAGRTAGNWSLDKAAKIQTRFIRGK